MATIYGTYNDTPALVTVSNISNIVTDQLRLYYDLGRSNSYPGTGAILYDISGNNTHATMYNAGGVTYSTLPVGPPTFVKTNLGEFVFDGVNDFGKFTAFGTTTAFSVSAWVKFTNGGDRGILSHCSGGPVGESYGVNGGKMFYMYYFNTWQTATGNATINDGTWKNIVFAKNGTNMVMYVNGVQDFTTTLVGSVNSSINTFGSKWGPCNSDNYGAGNDSYGSVFNGSIAVLMLHTKQLSAAEVLRNYNNLKSRFGL